MLTKIRNKMKNQKGFTLVELVVVVVILGILAAIAVPKLMTSSESARGTAIAADLRTIDSAIQMAISDGYTVAANDDATSVTEIKAHLAGTPVPPIGKFKTPKGVSDQIESTTTSYGIDANGRAYVKAKTNTALTADK